MNYIYDILINLNDKYFDFYDWNEDDDVVHIKKTPIIRVDSFLLNKIKYGNVVLEKTILDKIYKKTEVFKNNKFNKYKYLCAVSDSNEALVVNLDSDGNVIGKSSLLIDEENDIIDLCDSMLVNNFEFNIINNYDCCEFKTRKELEVCDYIKKELDVIDDEKLKYLYFECFNEKECDIKKIFDKILFEIGNNFDLTNNKIYEFLKLTSVNK